MRVRVLYFAALREIAAKDEETIDLPPSVITVRDFAKYLATHYSALSARLDHLRVARNEQFANDDEKLCEGDVLALIPPVAGGA